MLADGSAGDREPRAGARTSSGRSGEAAGTSASSPRSCSACTPVSTVVAGPTFWAVEHTEEVLSRTASSSRRTARLNGFFAFASVPPAPPFPEELHLRKVCGVVWCFIGEDDKAAPAMAPLLDSLPEPLMHGPAPMPHPMLQGAFDGLYPAGDQWYWRADFVKEIPDAALAIHASPARRCRRGSRRCTCTRSTVPRTTSTPTDTAWFYRDANWGSVFAGVDPDPANVDAIRKWTSTTSRNYIRSRREARM